jgi:hypothetical protein
LLGEKLHKVAEGRRIQITNKLCSNLQIIRLGIRVQMCIGNNLDCSECVWLWVVVLIHIQKFVCFV